LNIGIVGLFSCAEAHSYKSRVEPQQSIIDVAIPATPPASAAAQWAALAVLSLVIAVPLVWLRVPAALFLAPMLSAIIVSLTGGSVEVPSWAAIAAQGLIGCMIARMLPPSVVGEVVIHWPLFIAIMLSVIAASGLLGWTAARLRLLPGTTVIWGLSPGAAPTMIIMAEAYGADAQFVALMQYLRLFIVAAVASAVARVWGVGHLHAARAANWLPPVHLLALAETLALATTGPIVAALTRKPVLALLLPMFGGVFLSAQGWIAIEMPPWLLAIGYAVVGWRVGLRFTRALLIHAAKVLPRMIACTFALIAICAGLAAILAVGAGVDPLTAYLATSPGGADSVAIIAAQSNVDAPFVMAMQTLRFIGVMLLGPSMAAWVARHSGQSSAAQSSSA
jgi:membrane AbrB-like protein